MMRARLLRVQLMQVLDDAVRGSHKLVIAGARSQRTELHLRNSTASVRALPLHVGSSGSAGTPVTARSSLRVLVAGASISVWLGQLGA